MSYTFSGWFVIHPDNAVVPRVTGPTRGLFFADVCGSHNGVFLGIVNWTGGSIRSSDTLQEGQSLSR